MKTVKTVAILLVLMIGQVTFAQEKSYKETVIENPTAEEDLKVVADHLEAIMTNKMGKAASLLADSYEGRGPAFEETEYIYYDQLDSHYSDKPNDSTLWTIEHFVEEVEQVRKALNLDKDNFYLLGQSWGGMLAMEYALKYQENLKGLVISNMMASIPEYEKYAAEVLGPQLPPEVYKEIKALEAAEDFGNPRYTELVMEHYYTKHVLHKPLDEWPEFVNRAFSHLNPNIYIYMQGYSEFGVTGDATLKGWDVSGRLNELGLE